ncbi:phosphatidylinositol-4-phosphate 5-Kinase domain-containing protein [Ditylenchus destructor]|nr:phosphatidylinositol-4-phosphate 5-Kinase domain-containing protein [Ditylenchus destructor]
MMSNKIASRFSLTVILVAFISPTDQGPSKWYDKLLSVQQMDNIQEGIFASIERLIGIEDESEMKAKYNANVEEKKVKEIKNWWDLLPRSKDIPPTVHYTPIKMRDGAYQMNQYMPESFLKFWKDILKIDLHTLKKSFAASRDDESKRMRPLGDDHAGKSGQSLFLTHDHIWLVKTVSAPELLKLAEMAERYYQHWAELKKSTHSSSSSHASSPTDKHNSYTHNSLITVYMGCYTYVEVSSLQAVSNP